MSTKAKNATSSNNSKADKLGRTYGTGRRKNSIARVWVKPGKGEFTVNGKKLADYLPRQVLQMIVNQPFVTINAAGQYDVFCTTRGGGLSGQAGAIRLGISRALVEMNEEFRPLLRKSGFLTRDARTVERKKYGKHKARKSTQFSKR